MIWGYFLVDEREDDESEPLHRVGILAYRGSEFPTVVIRRLRSEYGHRIQAEFVHLHPMAPSPSRTFDLIIDRISHIAPFAGAYLKAAACRGTLVVNNPFQFRADDKFFNFTVAKRLGLPIPRTVMLPPKQLPEGVDDPSDFNISWPESLEDLAQRVGFPAVLKPIDGFGWREVHFVHSYDELVNAYENSADNVMLLQEKLPTDRMVRVVRFGDELPIIVDYDPDSRTYAESESELTDDLRQQLVSGSKRLCDVLGYRINSLEYVLVDDTAYAIDFMNPVPDANPSSIGVHHFNSYVDRCVSFIVHTLEAGPNHGIVAGDYPARFLPLLEPQG